jgi:hypothetical protein
MQFSGITAHKAKTISTWTDLAQNCRFGNDYAFG